MHKLLTLLHVRRQMLASEADALALAIDFGVTPILLVRGWAERHIFYTENAPTVLEELAVPQKKDETIAKLRHMAVGSDKATVSRFALGLAQLSLSVHSISYRDAALFLSHIASLDYVPDSATKVRMQYFAEDMALVEVGEFAYKLEERVGKQIDTFLDKSAVNLFMHLRNSNGHRSTPCGMY